VTAVRWGLLSTAAIGATMVRAARGSTTSEFVAVASRDAGRAAAFADKHGLARSFASYEELLASDEVDAVYVALPVSMHTEWTVRALRAGKHVLCEKPFATTAADAARCFDAAAAADRLVVEGLMYRYHPQTALARELLAQGSIGRLALVRAALSITAPPGDIRRAPGLGGGAVLDLGTYCSSAIRLFAGEPVRVYADQVRDGVDGVDLRLAATLTMRDDVLAQLDIGLDLIRRDELELVGTEGKIVVPDPWLCRGSTLQLHRDGVREDVPVDLAGAGLAAGDEDGVYRLELDRVSAAITGTGQLPFGGADAVHQARLLEALLESSRRAVPVRLDQDAA
jgi:predicted dehydrogenase